MKKFIYFLVLSFLFCCNNKNPEATSKATVKTEKKKKKEQTKKVKSCDLLPRIKNESKINIALSEISKEIYEKGKTDIQNKILEFSNSDSIEKVLIKKHPKLFIKKDSSLIFQFKNDTKIFSNNRVQEKTYSDYSIKGSYQDLIFIVQNFYEDWLTSAINIKTGKVYSFSGKPNFINESLFYSYSNYYGDEDLTIVDVKNEETISLTFSNIEFRDSYYSTNGISNYIRFKVEYLNSTEKKYLQIANY